MRPSLDDRDLVLRLIATLPPKQRAALALRYYEDLSYHHTDLPYEGGGARRKVRRRHHPASPG
jgi:hypothetical protein